MEYLTSAVYSSWGGIKWGASKIPYPSSQTCKNAANGTWDVVKKTPIPSATTCAIGGAAVAAATVVGPLVGGATVGFGTAGITKGSIAAGVHSSIGAVKVGSLFAWLQSFGATGATVIPSVKVGVGAATGAVAYLKSKL